ncbi:MAG: hypothetical protein ACPGTS_00090 [Minisyncoccia bacterium]
MKEILNYLKKIFGHTVQSKIQTGKVHRMPEPKMYNFSSMVSNEKIYLSKSIFLDRLRKIWFNRAPTCFKSLWQEVDVLSDITFAEIDSGLFVKEDSDQVLLRIWHELSTLKPEKTFFKIDLEQIDRFNLPINYVFCKNGEFGNCIKFAYHAKSDQWFIDIIKIKNEEVIAGGSRYFAAHA